MAAGVVVTMRAGLSVAVPLVGLLAVVAPAALPDPAAPPPPPPVTTSTTVPPTTTTTAPPLASDEAATVVQKGDQLEVTLATDVLFEFNLATLTPAAVETLTTLAPKITRSATPGVVAIVGHTDGIGSEAVNQPLSKVRAQAVQAVLAAARPDLQFQVSGRGAAEPVAPNEIAGADNPEGRARNRRVTITFAAPR